MELNDFYIGHFWWVCFFSNSEWIETYSKILTGCLFYFVGPFHPDGGVHLPGDEAEVEVVLGITGNKIMGNYLLNLS